MPNNNNGNTWSSSIRGRAMRGNLLHEYTLKTLAVPDSDAQSPFQYSIFRVSLTEVRKPIPKGSLLLFSTAKSSFFWSILFT